MTDTVVRNDESLDEALRRFNRNVANAGILTDLRRSRYYEKPSERRNRKRRAAESKRLRALRRAERREAQRGGYVR